MLQFVFIFDLHLHGHIKKKEMCHANYNSPQYTYCHNFQNTKLLLVYTAQRSKKLIKDNVVRNLLKTRESYNYIWRRAIHLASYCLLTKSETNTVLLSVSLNYFYIYHGLKCQYPHFFP